MLQPKKPKFRKQFKGRMHGSSKGGNNLNFGSFGLKALTPARITSRQIESARRAITRHLKRSGRLWIRIFPDVPVSKKPAEVRYHNKVFVTIRSSRNCQLEIAAVLSLQPEKIDEQKMKQL